MIYVWCESIKWSLGVWGKGEDLTIGNSFTIWEDTELEFDVIENKLLNDSRLNQVGQ